MTQTIEQNTTETQDALNAEGVDTLHTYPEDQTTSYAGHQDTSEITDQDTLDITDQDTSDITDQDTLHTEDQHTAAGGQNTYHIGGQHTLSSNSDSNRGESETTILSLISRNNQLLEENELLSAENARLKEEIIHLKSHVQSLSVELLDDTQVLMYTGVNRKIFDSLLTWLQPVSKPKKKDSHLLLPSQKLLMVLMRMRQNFPQGDLACRFVVHQSTVSHTLQQWILMLATHLRSLIRWPTTNAGPTVPPYDVLPNSVGIIDGTEIFIQRPSNLETQKSSYSDYKSHTTIKYLVAIDTFTGVFTFVSPGFSGNCSDRYTVEHSELLDVLKPGQRILADKGHTARDLFAQKRCFLTIPSFLSDGRLTGQQAIQSRLIASVRIKVENAIKRIKDFKIFSETLCNHIN